MARGAALSARFPHVQVTVHRVRYGETDRMGVVYYAHYFAWFEAGRADYLRELGADYRVLEEERGIFLPVAQASAQYHKGAAYDELIEVSTRVSEANRARLSFDYQVHRRSDATLLATGATTHVAVGRDGAARMMPRELLALIPTAAD